MGSENVQLLFLRFFSDFSKCLSPSSLTPLTQLTPAPLDTPTHSFPLHPIRYTLHPVFFAVHLHTILYTLHSHTFHTFLCTFRPYSCSPLHLIPYTLRIHSQHLPTPTLTPLHSAQDFSSTRSTHTYTQHTLSAPSSTPPSAPTPIQRLGLFVLSVSPRCVVSQGVSRPNKLGTLDYVSSTLLLPCSLLSLSSTPLCPALSSSPSHPLLTSVCK